jgi:hypothetical protein
VRGYRTGIIDGSEYRGQYVVRPREHIVIPESQDHVAHRFQLRCSIGVRANGAHVLASIQFDGDMVLEAGEIGDKLANRCLTFELDAV